MTYRLRRQHILLSVDSGNVQKRALVIDLRVAQIKKAQKPAALQLISLLLLELTALSFQVHHATNAPICGERMELLFTIVTLLFLFIFWLGLESRCTAALRFCRSSRFEN